MDGLTLILLSNSIRWSAAGIREESLQLFSWPLPINVVANIQQYASVGIVGAVIGAGGAIDEPTLQDR
jgi:hypothetical protein